MVNELSVLIENYPLIRDLRQINSTINSFRNYVQLTARTQFNSLVTTGENASYATLQTYIWALTEMILGPTALHDQLAYLRRTQKPIKSSIPKLIDMIEVINNLLTHIRINTNKQSANKLVSKIIAPNLPSHLRDAFDLAYILINATAQTTRNLTLISN